ncbi:MAG TPA: Crp/Fnr family transcriptional regulator [Candidatus Pristimantibacillus sp.]|jgi:CRP/FNR family transcriptional regulator|nr:Crp/Fnr family transcriptional regulator [Candidatus Pristimantibacillus sp.]
MDEIEQKVHQFFLKYPEKRFSKKEIVVHAGEEPRGVFYMVSGRVNQYDITAAGVETVVNTYKAPAFFPMSWAINRTPNDYFFESATDVVARIAPAGDVVAFVKSEPEVLLDLLSRVYRGTDGLLRRLAHLMGGDARSRLLFEIIVTAYRFGQPAADGSILLPFKEGDLAKHTGLARETVNRTIQDLKAQGLVVVDREGLIVLDVNDLQAELGAGL